MGPWPAAGREQELRPHLGRACEHGRMTPLRPLLASLAVLLAAAPSRAQASFEVLVDTSTPIPGGVGTFAGFRAVALEGEVLVFHGIGFPDGQGIYRLDARGLVRVVDDRTQIPGLPDGWTLFPDEPSLDRGRVAFGGAFDEIAFLVGAAEGLAVRVRPGEPIPGLDGAFLQDFFTCSLDGGDLGFTAFAGGGPLPPSLGIYGTRGGLHTIADVLTTVPGAAGTFTSFGFNPTYDAGEAAFVAGHATGSGVYRGDGGTLRLVADETTPVPGGTGTFTGFPDGPTIRGDTVAFRASGPGGQRGVYVRRGGALLRIADTTTPIPGGSGSFVSFSELTHHGPALDGTGSIAFRATGSAGQQGIYATRGGPLQAVVAAGDTIAGRTVTALDLGREGHDHGRLAFLALFDDGSGAIVLATPP